MSESKKIKHANKKTIDGCSLKPIWKFYNRGQQLDSSGHYEAICKACEKLFLPGKPLLIEKHIISNCAYISKEVKEAVIYIVESHKKTSSISRTKHSSEQISLDEFLESIVIPDTCIESINRALIKAFVCCGLPWRLIEHPFFIEFLKQLHPAYILLILINIGVEKFIGIVTDAGANINLARNQISQKYTHILSSGLKTYIDPRWTTVYAMLKSVYQLETCLKE
ncbi:38207_t:CDS:2, partial [Gigaspora margarita]